MHLRVSLWLIIFLIHGIDSVTSTEIGQNTINNINGLTYFCDLNLIRSGAIVAGSAPLNTRVLTIDDLRNNIKEKIEVNDPVVRKRAILLAAKYPGDLNIGQICSIYEDLVGGWIKINDPLEFGYLSSAKETIELAEDYEKKYGSYCSGIGDSDDFAILTSALIGAIGGKTRIILAKHPNGFHAYTEVYIGNYSLEQDAIQEDFKWLRTKYRKDSINTHTDLNTSEVWLNLDMNAGYPGGPFTRALSLIPILITTNTGTKSIIAPPLVQTLNETKIVKEQNYNFDWFKIIGFLAALFAVVAYIYRFIMHIKEAVHKDGTLQDNDEKRGDSNS